MNRVLDGRVAVITGASRGLGRAIAEAYVEAGAKVALGSRSSDGIEQVVSHLRQNGGMAIGKSTDVGDPDQVQELLQVGLSEYGQLDIWVNNAAISSPYGGTVQVSQESFLTTLRTNIHGAYFGSVAASRHFIEQGSGKLINVVGAGARRPEPYQNAYASSKAWIKSFTLALAQELKETGVEVFVFNPGLIVTDLVTSPQVIQGYEARVRPLESVLAILAKPIEVPAQKAVWLASASSDGKTGLELKTTSSAEIAFAFLKEAVRRLVGKPSTPVDVHIESFPAAWTPNGAPRKGSE